MTDLPGAYLITVKEIEISRTIKGKPFSLPFLCTIIIHNDMMAYFIGVVLAISYLGVVKVFYGIWGFHHPSFLQSVVLQTYGGGKSSSNCHTGRAREQVGDRWEVRVLLATITDKLPP